MYTVRYTGRHASMHTCENRIIHAIVQLGKKAFAWQASDKAWSDGYEAIAASCGITVEDFGVSVVTAR